MEKKLSEEKMVSLLFDKDGYLVRAGDPSVFPKKEVSDHILNGGELKKVSIEQYRQEVNSYKWLFDKK